MRLLRGMDQSRIFGDYFSLFVADSLFGPVVVTSQCVCY
jgi:hypothetical protein